MKTSSQTTLFNMCMIIDKEKNKVLVQDKINSDWNGITFPGEKLIRYFRPENEWYDSLVQYC